MFRGLTIDRSCVLNQILVAQLGAGPVVAAGPLFFLRFGGECDGLFGSRRSTCSMG
jgi:hypothetical protein